MLVNAPVYSEQNGVHFINIYVEQSDGTFRRSQDEPLRLLRNNIKGVSNIQGELITGATDRTERSWGTATVTFHYGHPQSFYKFLRDMIAKNKYFVFSKPQLSGRISRFDLHELQMKPGTSQRHLSLLKEKYLESVQLWTVQDWEKKQQEKQQITADAAEHAATPASLDVDFIQEGVQDSDSDFIDLDTLGSTALTSTPSTDSLTPAEVVGEKTLVKRYGEVSGLTSDDGTERQFPSRKKDRKSHFLEKFIFTID